MKDLLYFISLCKDISAISSRREKKRRKKEKKDKTQRNNRIYVVYGSKSWDFELKNGILIVFDFLIPLSLETIY